MQKREDASAVKAIPPDQLNQNLEKVVKPRYQHFVKVATDC